MPMDSQNPARVVLKVDVDTKVGLRDGVPRLLDLLARLGLKASLFISMGPDNSGRALKRLFRPGFLKKQLKSGAAGAYGPVTMMYGLLLPAPIIARSAPGVINRCINAGHEVGLHGWDHVFWHDRMRNFDRERLTMELGQAYNLFCEITGFAPASFASPGWQVTNEALEIMEGLGISHVSCTRGKHPFRPLVNGRALNLLELPTTMPSLDELLALDGVDQSSAAAYLADQVKPGALNVFTMHAEVEGRALAPVFGEFCRRLQDQGAEFPRLLDAAKEEAAAAPTEEVVWGPIEGRAYEVAWQASALEPGF
jgi:undecaprenyl phosphate-alpha-L-ara4FN deformylase